MPTNLPADPDSHGYCKVCDAETYRDESKTCCRDCAAVLRNMMAAHDYHQPREEKTPRVVRCRLPGER